MAGLPVIGITMGDAAGIGPEVVVKAVANPVLEGICRPVVVGSRQVMEWTVQRLSLGLKVEGVESSWVALSKPGILPVWDCVPLSPEEVVLGQVSARTGRAGGKALMRAVEAALEGAFQGIVTGPVSKAALHLAGYPFPGQTEFLAHLTHTTRFAMLLVGGGLRVALVTTHCPLEQVSRLITSEAILEKLEILHRALRTHFGTPEPRIGVCALNPHAGEGGVLGREEERVIGPAVEEANVRGIKAVGPLPADSLFARFREEGFDAILAMYHDQGLIPLKMLSFGHGVNVTLGLPIIRTSPDHGTAFDIAGQGVADPASMGEAIRLAARLAQRK